MKERPILFSGEEVRSTLSGAKTQTRRPLDPAMMKVRLPREVRSDSFGLGILQPLPTVAAPGFHRAQLFGGGAVALTDTAPSLGVKPGEFHFVCPWADGDTHLGNYGRDGQRWAIVPRESALWVRETHGSADRYYQGHENDVPSVIAYRADQSAIQFNAPRPVAVPARDTLSWNWDLMRWTPSIHMPRWASRITLPIAEVRIERVQSITAEDARAEGVTVPRCDCEVCSRGLAICPADATSYIEGFRDIWAATYGREAWEANPWVWVIRWEKATVRG